jgi:hypothetical protein
VSLQLADQYYEVARDVERQAQFMMETARMLNAIADQLCERNMRLKLAAGELPPNPPAGAGG